MKWVSRDIFFLPKPRGGGLGSTLTLTWYPEIEELIKSREKHYCIHLCCNTTNIYWRNLNLAPACQMGPWTPSVVSLALPPSLAFFVPFSAGLKTLPLLVRVKLELRHGLRAVGRIQWNERKKCAARTEAIAWKSGKCLWVCSKIKYTYIWEGVGGGGGGVGDWVWQLSVVTGGRVDEPTAAVFKAIIALSPFRRSWASAITSISMDFTLVKVMWPMR